ncbi:hypothetical protein LCGC14_2904330, partial [marine sediment metagenome]
SSGPHGGFTGWHSSPYALNVSSGSGGGIYGVGQIATIVADAPPAGMVFNAWTGDTAGIDNVNADTTITMPASETSITATYQPEIEPNYWLGDLNHDLVVDVLDLNMVLIVWGKTVEDDPISVPLADVNYDGTVDISDLNAVLIDWGKTGFAP